MFVYCVSRIKLLLLVEYQIILNFDSLIKNERDKMSLMRQKLPNRS